MSRPDDLSRAAPSRTPLPSSHHETLQMTIDAMNVSFASKEVVSPHALLINRQPEGKLDLTYVPVESWNTDQEKQEWALMVRAISLARSADQVVMVSEAWAVASNSAHDVAEFSRKHGSLEHHPDRVEVLLASVEDEEGSSFTSVPIKHSAGRRFLLESDVEQALNNANTITWDEYAELIKSNGMSPQLMMLYVPKCFRKEGAEEAARTLLATKLQVDDLTMEELERRAKEEGVEDVLSETRPSALN